MPTRFRGRPEEVRALNALIPLLRAADAFSGSLQREVASSGLTGSQFGILESLLHLGPLCQGDLAQKLLRSCGSITSVVAGMEKRGWLTRKREAEDKRFVRVELTPAGRKLIEGLFPRHAEEVAKQFSVLTPIEQEQLRKLCRKLGLALARR